MGSHGPPGAAANASAIPTDSAKPHTTTDTASIRRSSATPSVMDTAIEASGMAAAAKARSSGGTSVGSTLRSATKVSV